MFNRNEEYIEGMPRPLVFHRVVPFSNPVYLEGAALPGPQCAINSIFASISGVAVTSVNVGANFKLYVAYRAHNLSGATWMALITAVAVNSALAQLSPFLGRCRVKGNTGFGGEIIETAGGGTIGDDINTPVDVAGNIITGGQDWVMPAGSGPLSIRVKMWINNASETSTVPPPVNW